MKKFVKTLLGLSICQACLIGAANAGTYTLEEIGALDTYKYTYSQAGNSANQFVISADGSYNIPVQFQYLDEDDFDDIERYAERNYEIVFGLEEIEDKAALEAGNPTANDLAWTIRWLQALGGNQFYQEIYDVSSFINRAGTSVELVPFDTFFNGGNEYTRSTVSYVNGINESGWAYGNGSAPFLPQGFIDSNDDVEVWFIRDFSSKAFIYQNDLTTPLVLEAPENRYGGDSAIFDMEGNIAVGYASVSVEEEVLDIIERDDDGGCNDPGRIDDQPQDSCIMQYRDALYNVEAYKWIINDDGTVSGESLGNLVTPDVDDDRTFASYAQAINSNGIAVGYAHGWVDEEETDPSSNENRSFYAVVYKDGEVYDFTEDHGEYFDSRAYDINESNIATGYVSFYNEGVLRTKFYYINADESNPTMVFPEGFFQGSSSEGYAINNNGLIVGSAQVERQDDSSGGSRRTAGFLYDTNSESFSDVNSFLTCDQAVKYDILEARDIDNSNVIYGSAVVKVPRIDAKGQPVLDANGEALLEDVIRAVKLIPNPGGELENCAQEEGELIERNGASLGWLSLLFLLPLRIFRK